MRSSWSPCSLFQITDESSRALLACPAAGRKSQTAAAVGGLLFAATHCPTRARPQSQDSQEGKYSHNKLSSSTGHWMYVAARQKAIRKEEHPSTLSHRLHNSRNSTSWQLPLSYGSLTEVSSSLTLWLPPGIRTWLDSGSFSMLFLHL